VVELTKLCSTGGCAAKYDAPLLRQLLAALPSESPPNLLVGLDPPDDAAVVRLNGDTGLVFSVDFFPPIVDDPHIYGRIAANNALNDIYAMGGNPILALSIAAFPGDLPPQDVADIVRGAAEQCLSVGAVLAGGHTIRDKEPKFGLAVAGTVPIGEIWRKSGALPGDRLLLAKPIGTGVLATARRRGEVSNEDFDKAVDCMLRSNKQVADVLRETHPHAVTDVTGFGLAGHASEVAQASGARIVIDMAAVPMLPSAERCARAGVRTSAHRSNFELIEGVLDVDGIVDESTLALAVDPQTAGGLLFAVPEEDVAAVTSRLDAAGQPVTEIAEVTSGSGVALTRSR
jgi:selenide, water dikinase